MVQYAYNKLNIIVINQKKKKKTCSYINFKTFMSFKLHICIKQIFVLLIIFFFLLSLLFLMR